MSIAQKINEKTRILYQLGLSNKDYVKNELRHAVSIYPTRDVDVILDQFARKMLHEYYNGCRVYCA